MKITGTRSYIIVDFGDRQLKIAGELTTTPAFYAIASSIRHWEQPFDHELISETERKTIITRILNEYGGTVQIVFEE